MGAYRCGHRLGPNLFCQVGAGLTQQLCLVRPDVPVSRREGPVVYPGKSPNTSARPEEASPSAPGSLWFAGHCEARERLRLEGDAQLSWLLPWLRGAGNIGCAGVDLVVIFVGSLTVDVMNIGGASPMTARKQNAMQLRVRLDGRSQRTQTQVRTRGRVQHPAGHDDRRRTRRPYSGCQRKKIPTSCPTCAK